MPTHKPKLAKECNLANTSISINSIILKNAKTLNMKPIIKILSVFFLVVLISSSCGSRSNESISGDDDQQIEITSGNNPTGDSVVISPAPHSKFSKVTFFIENSGSMKGYVVGSSSYVDMLSNIANHPDLIKNNIKQAFYLTSGTSTPRRVTILRKSLIPAYFNESRSDLNNLFKTALDSTNTNSVTILVSDGIYDMCPDPNPLNTLSILGRDLRSVFIRKLQSSDFQTIVIKCESSFNGRYYPGNCCPACSIIQLRPYYIWIFGNSDVLKKYFPDNYLNSLNGYVDMARFFIYPKGNDNFRPNSHKKIGTYHPSRDNANTFERARSNSSNVFQFSIAVDFSHLPLNDNYLSDISNYFCTNGFEVVSIDKPTDISKLGYPNQTHLIVVKKIGNPIGTLTVSLINKGYPWITTTNINDDCNIRGNSDQTFGFEVLNKAIIEAYDNFNPANEIYKFTINLKN